MNKKQIIEYLSDNGIDDIEEIISKEDTLVLKFYYYYDEIEIAAAENYAVEESEEDEEEKWRDDFYIPYLIDIAEDNVGEIIEEICEKFDLVGEFVSRGIDDEEDNNEFIVAFSKNEVDIESIIEKLEI
ncbi:hypothetical protein [Clostridium brassicae]|uniref:Uncharacterized protein n=1 Tax=Clostridium brassicae TaxID=2999072 RepID=A0ABT4D5W0_9CLOT|nr:hypothetical protein [Clostridium brassicae]MCY6957677.1 hypothetical protein [Clostridium brassicae]